MPEGGRLEVWLAVRACTATGAGVVEVGGHVEGDCAAGLLADWCCRGKGPACLCRRGCLGGPDC